jgi:ubiquitin-protein ligase E3 A
MAIYNGVVLDVHFPSVVYKLLLGEEPLFSDLAQVDAELHRGLQQLLDFEGDVQGKI